MAAGAAAPSSRCTLTVKRTGSSQPNTLPGFALQTPNSMGVRGRKPPGVLPCSSCTASTQTVARSGGSGLSRLGLRSGPTST